MVRVRVCGFGRVVAAVVAVLCAGLSAAPDDAWAGDGRRMLGEREAVAWRGVGRVNIAGSRFCTGTLIDDRHVLTASHCLFNPRTGQRVPPDMIHFVAGLRLGRHVGSQRVAAAAVLPEYSYGEPRHARELAADVALLRLARPMAPEMSTPFATARYAGAEGALSIVSYARDRAHAPSIERRCATERRQGPVMLLSCEVKTGASGSPVFRDGPDGAKVVAIVSAQTRSAKGPRALAIAVEPALSRLRALLPPGP
jgi:V8-like Glu-specific endopeptidase